MVVPLTQPTRPLARELTVFLVAVFVGSLSGLVTGECLVRWAAAASTCLPTDSMTGGSGDHDPA
jgi:hypothetical protein